MGITRIRRRRIVFLLHGERIAMADIIGDNVPNYSTMITGATRVKFSHRRHSIVFDVIDIV